MFAVFMYMLVLSKFMPKMDNEILDMIKEDYYYCCLFPVTIIASVAFVYTNWMSLKFFRHN
jgi:phosphatidylinositol glycan anchor class Y biosynthesis protein